MAKYQLGNSPFLDSRGEMYPANSIQEFPDDMEPSITWQPLDAGAETALKELAKLKTERAKAAKEQRDIGLPVFTPKLLKDAPKELKDSPAENTQAMKAQQALSAQQQKEKDVYSMNDVSKGRGVTHTDDIHGGKAPQVHPPGQKRHSDKDI